MADTRVLWAPIADPDSIQGELPATAVTYTDLLNAPGACTVTFPVDPHPGLALVTADTFGEARTVLWVVRDGVPVWSGVVWGWSVSLDSDTITADAEGWLSYVRRRIIDQTTVYTGVDQAQIANALVTLSGAPVEVDAGANHGVTRDRTWFWWEGKPIGEALEQLAAVRDGFDFKFTPIDTGTGPRVLFETVHPATGRDTDHVLEVGTNCALTLWTGDGKQFATRVRGFGSGQGADAMLWDVAAQPGPFLQLDATATYSDVTEVNTLIANLDRDLLRVGTPIRLAEVRMWPGTDPGPGVLRVGDLVDFTCRRGFVDLDRARHRVTGTTVAVTPDGGETMSVSLAPSRMFLL